MQNKILKHPLDAIAFDCDGTLCSIEGIVYLAKQNGVGKQIRQITEEIMTTGGLNQQIYAKRLNLVRPTKKQINHLIDDYYNLANPNLQKVITILQSLNKQVFILSAGVNPAVSGFAEKLGIPAANAFAVDLTFDHNGNYLDFDHTSPLTYNTGKQEIVENLVKTYPRIAYVGDGANDLAVKKFTQRFIGYGGVFYREEIKAQSDFYLENPDMLQLLPLLLTEDEIGKIDADLLR